MVPIFCYRNGHGPTERTDARARVRAPVLTVVPARAGTWHSVNGFDRGERTTTSLGTGLPSRPLDGARKCRQQLAGRPVGFGPLERCSRRRHGSVATDGGRRRLGWQTELVPAVVLRDSLPTNVRPFADFVHAAGTDFRLLRATPNQQKRKNFSNSGRCAGRRAAPPFLNA